MFERYCNSCKTFKLCAYRGIINPCEEWQPHPEHQRLRNKAKEIKGMAMTFTEAQFVDGCTTLEFFSPKQSGWLRSIYERVAYVQG